MPLAITTRAQREAIEQLFQRTYGGPRPEHPINAAMYWRAYREFRKTAIPAIGINCIMIPWCGMLVGIELDGDTHT